MDMAVRGRLFYFSDITNMAQRVTFYIDGFNFYYGLRRTKRNEPQWADYYWIDMVKLIVTCHLTTRGKEDRRKHLRPHDSRLCAQRHRHHRPRQC